MSETTQSSVEDLEKEFQTTGTEDEHTPIGPEATNGNGGVETKDEHTPIKPEATNGNGVETMDEHTPIKPEAAKREEGVDTKG
jgi:hypothetical protein